MRLQKRLLRIGLITGGLVDDAAAVTAGVSHQNDAVNAIRFNAKLNYAETDRNTKPHCFTIDQQSHVNITYRENLSGTTKEEEMGISSVTEGTTIVLGAKTRTGSDPGGGIDLLTALQLHNTTRQGVTQVPGLVRLRPAYYLQDDPSHRRARRLFNPVTWCIQLYRGIPTPFSGGWCPSHVGVWAAVQRPRKAGLKAGGVEVPRE
ncbi:hypothetical protein G5I_12969 [Acromyrmex echinatior]|uniref:Uncharacterized protein n=1 Tax=Acromyrmex echinatior TaxID=103372 RepID=F4X3Q8_ACREC|nr:hypothetical protein G5I_12969 [Acromyrmex echinatior]